MSASLAKFSGIRRQDLPIALASAGYFFLLLASYYILRPLRETEGTNGDSLRLAWLFTGTMLAMVALAPLFSWLVNRFPRERFIPLANRAFAVQMLGFYALWRIESDLPAWLSGAFFIWVSVFNVFVVSVFWSFMAEVHTLEDSKRLFGPIAVGGTLGAIVGGGITKLLVGELGQANLLLVSVLLLELATQCMAWIARRRPPHAVHIARERPEAAETGGLWNGIALILRSRFLAMIAFNVLLASTIGTILYMEQAQLVRAAAPDKVERTALFATIDIWTNAATLLVQLFVTGAVIRRLGIGVALLAQPVCAVLALIGMAVAPVLGVLIAAQVVLRTLQHALSRPSREMLFTEVGREARYKTKNFVDTFCYRLGDQAGVWGFNGLFGALSLPLGTIAWCAAPLAGLWCLVAGWLGREQRRRSSE